ncbi:MAG: hypothetical protein MI700_01005 [Balneolales bacterium]|nr:hypothetical protein [Balneolales bacterium]
MLKSIVQGKKGKEGYVYVSYGHPKYLKHTIASVVTLRRHDKSRPVALVCTDKHRKILEEKNLERIFDIIHPLPEEHASIVGFKHNVHHYLFFEKNLFLDSDIVWCKNPNSLWSSLSPFEFTITGKQISDNFFGASKGVSVLSDILLRKRNKTLKKFGLTYLSRVQSGMMYASDSDLTKKVCELAAEMLSRKDETHFKSRKMEKGRTMESCEWSLAMAMSKLNVPTYPWLQGQNSPQLDYISSLTEHDDDFEYVSCKFYCDDFVYSFRGLTWGWFRESLFSVFSMFPRKGDYLMATPYCLHFGWYHDKQPFFSFSEKCWNRLQAVSEAELLMQKTVSSNNPAQDAV